MEFYDFQIRAWQTRKTQAQVMVQASPVGDMRRPVTVKCDPGVLRRSADQAVGQLWKSQLARRMVIELGLSLSGVLLPRPVYNLLSDTLKRLPSGNGVRLRLCLDESLIDLPWELLYRPDAKDEDSLAGFLALDPRISIVRESPSGAPALTPSAEKQRLVFATAVSGDKWIIGAKEEFQALTDALAPVQGLLQIEAVTADGDHIENALASAAGIVHYSGTTGVIDGRAALAKRFEGPAVMEAEALGNLLHAAGTRLAVLSADRSGRWGIVEPLLHGGLSALIAAQDILAPDAYVGFCGKLYGSLAVGLSLDEAATLARLHVMSARGEEDYNWAGFMVYLPTSNAVLFPRPESSDISARQQAVRQDREQTVQAVTAVVGQAPGGAAPIDKRHLRQAMLGAFTQDEIETLCSDVEQDLEDDGFTLQVSLALVGKEAGLEDKIRQLIEYLDRRSVLDYLVSEVRRARPKITF